MFDTKELKGFLRVDDIASIAESVGISVRYAGSAYHIHCPGHILRLGKEDANDGSCVLTDTGYHCFSCGESIDVFEMLQEATGCTFIQAVNLVANYCGVQEKPIEQLFPLSRKETAFLGFDYDEYKNADKQTVFYVALICAEKKRQDIQNKISLFCNKDGKGAPLVFEICQQDGYLDESIQVKLYNSYKADLANVDSILEKLGLR